jgi:serine/arginine repetitive matrix protein 2
MQTPAPALRSGRARSNTLPSNTSHTVSTPLPIQRGNTFPLQTPAPPGAWNGTPGIGSVGRKSALKVRFDVTSESEAPSSPGQQDISLESIEIVHPSDNDQTQPPTSASNRANGVGYDEPRSAFSSFSSSDTSGAEDGLQTPVLRPTSMPPRTPPSVRVVDAFGREVTEENTGREVNDVSPMTLPSQDASPSRKPSVRIVDAMGREVQQNGDTIKPDTVEEELSRAQSLAKMRESISSLARDMDDVDLSSSSDDESDEAKLKELNEASTKARETREKLKQTIHAVQSGEEDWKAKYGSLRASMRKSISLVSFLSHYHTFVNIPNNMKQPSGTPDRPFPRSPTSGMVIGFIALAQVVFILYMLRYVHSKHTWHASSRLIDRHRAG